METKQPFKKETQKKKTLLDLINDQRQEGYDEAIRIAFGNEGIPDAEDMTPEQQLFIRNLKNRYSQVVEANIIDFHKKGEARADGSKYHSNSYVFDDGSKYYI